MTDHDLRELLHDQVADVTTTDLVGDAWARGRRRRARRVAGATTAGVVVAAVVVSGAVVLGGGQHRAAPAGPAQTPSSTSTPGPTFPTFSGGTMPDGHADGLPVYWSPTPAREGRLPSDPRAGLPGLLDLTGSSEPIAGAPIEQARASFVLTPSTGDPVFEVVGAGGQVRTLDVSGQLDDGPLTATSASLSPFGHAVALESAHEVHVYDLRTRRWYVVPVHGRSTDWVHWAGETQLEVFAADPDQQPNQTSDTYDVRTGRSSGTSRSYVAGRAAVPGARAVGRSRDAVQVWEGGRGLPVPAGTPSAPPYLDESAAKHRALLVLAGDRPSGCCELATVQGDLDRVVVYVSTDDGTTRLVAWRVGTHEFRLATTLGPVPEGTSVVGSYARW